MRSNGKSSCVGVRIQLGCDSVVKQRLAVFMHISDRSRRAWVGSDRWVERSRVG